MTLPSLANADTACARLESLAAAWEQKAYQLGSMADRQNALGDRLSGNVNRNFAWGGAANKHAQSAELMNQSIAAREYVRAGNCEEYLSMLQQNQQEAARQTDVKNRAKQVLWSYYQQHNQIPPPIPGNVSAIAAQIGASPSDYPTIQRVLEASYRDFRTQQQADAAIENANRVLQGLPPRWR